MGMGMPRAYYLGIMNYDNIARVQNNVHNRELYSVYFRKTCTRRVTVHNINHTFFFLLIKYSSEENKAKRQHFSRLHNAIWNGRDRTHTDEMAILAECLFSRCCCSFLLLFFFTSTKQFFHRQQLLIIIHYFYCFIFLFCWCKTAQLFLLF